jgi:glycerol-3-phosphate dehydrogenase
VDQAAAVAGLEERPSVTSALPIHGREATSSEDPRCAERIHPALEVRAGDVIHAARHEMARTVEDVLSRRSRALLLDAKASAEAAPRVAALLAEALGRDERWREAQVKAYRTLASGYLPP